MLKRALDGLGPIAELPVPVLCQSRQAELPSGAVQLVYSRYLGPYASELRFLHLFSAKVDVQTLFVYPDAAHGAAVLAAETVFLGQRPMVLVLDAPCLYAEAEKNPGKKADKGTAFHAAMQSLAHQHRLQNTEDVPEWYQDCRSGSDVFLRPQHHPNQVATTAADCQNFEAYVQDMAALYRQTWQLSAPLASGRPDLHAAALARYKTHHHQHSPGVALMSRCFGADWTQEFMAVFFG